jgi:hypothetical protein
MPGARKRPLRRRRPRRYRKKTVLGRPGRSIYPSTYKFKRSITEVVPINTTTAAPTGWTIVDNAMTTNMVFALEQLNDSADFKNLFRKYKITSVKTQMYFTNNQTFSDTNANIRVPQIMMYTNVNQTGKVNGTLTENYFLNTQTARKQTVIHNNRFPTTIWHKVKQLNRVYSSAQAAGNNDYVMNTPKYIATSDDTVEHYGMEMRLQSLIGGPVPSSTNEVPVSIKLVHTFYISCQGVE